MSVSLARVYSDKSCVLLKMEGVTICGFGGNKMLNEVYNRRVSRGQPKPSLTKRVNVGQAISMASPCTRYRSLSACRHSPRVCTSVRL